MTSLSASSRFRKSIDHGHLDHRKNGDLSSNHFPISDRASPTAPLALSLKPSAPISLQSAHLASLGVETRVHFAAPLPAQLAFGAAADIARRFPVAHEVAAQTLALPLHPAMQVSDVDRVADAVKAYLS